MKLDKELLTQHAKRLQAILNEKSTFAPYVARADFSKVLENSLNTLNAAEKKLKTVELSTKLSAKHQAKEFNKLGKNQFKLDENFKYEDEGDLIDNINYLVTYCNNIFKVNLDALVEGKQVTASNPTIDLKSKPEVEDMSEAAGFASAAGMGGFGPEAIYNNPFVMGKAMATMKEDVASGKLYTYTSKPKIIPIIKIVSVVTMCLLAIALIVGGVFAIMSGKLSIQSIDGKDTGVLRRAIGSGVFYILVAAFGIYPIYATAKTLKDKNDNSKFYFNWPWTLMFILMVILFVLLDISNTWTINSWCTIIEPVTSSVYKAFQGWKIMFIVILGLAGVSLIPMIIGAICNPKQDKGLIERKLKEYADQVMASSGFSVPPTQTPADVQKPVDVKKSEEKKTDKDKKDKK